MSMGKERNRWCEGDRAVAIKHRYESLLMSFVKHHDFKDCGGRDTFYVYDYNTPHEFVLAFCKTKVDAIDESMLKGEVLDFIDDYLLRNPMNSANHTHRS